MPEQSFFAELRKRKVVQVAAIYGAVAWGVTEVVVTVVEQLFLPQWVSTLAVIGFVVGFPVAMFLSWTFDITSAGLQRTAISSRRGKASIALSMALLVTGTAGLFFLIKPAIQQRGAEADIPILPNTVAVLPFDNASRNPDDAYLSAGLSDELRDQLGRVSGLRIAARSSSIAARQGNSDAKTMAERLGVANLLEGNMRQQGSILHVSVQLVDGTSGLSLWSKTFERGSRELLNIQQEIAEAVVREVLPGSDQLVAEPATLNATANELMLLARHYEQQVRERQDVDVETLQRAVQLYREATEADPESALAQSRLASAMLYLGDIDAAEAPIFRALSLNPKLAEVQNTLGKFYFARGLPEMGIPLARAVELNANFPDALADYAHWLWFNQGNEGVRELYQRALEMDPLNVARYAALGSFLALENHTHEAREVVRRVEQLFDGATAYGVIAEILDHLGDVDQSIAWTIRARNSEPNNPLHIEKLAEYYTDIGDHQTALALVPNVGVGLLFKMRRYDEMIDRAELLMIEYPDDIQLRAYLAVAYNAIGEFDTAIYVLRTSGLLDTIANGWRGTEEWDGFLALVNAAYGNGETEQARELVVWGNSRGYTSTSDTREWWIILGEACQQAILGLDDEARLLLERAQLGKHLAWEPMLKDSPCFDRFADDPVYLATVRHFDERRAEMRARLPVTLAEFGVAL